jgi:hypothetical protein
MNKEVLPVVRDERAIAVENESYRWSNLIFTLGLLADIEYRVWFLHDHNCWDLFALLIIGGNIPTIIQLSKGVLISQIARTLIVVAIVALLAGALTPIFELLYAHR